MQQYATKEALAEEIRKTAGLFIAEFDAIHENEMHLRLEQDQRTPYENLAYQLGWMALLQGWEQQEQQGKTPSLPAEGIKWNSLGALHQRFYEQYRGQSLAELRSLFCTNVEEIARWIVSLDREAVFEQGVRKWAASTPSNWPVWKWVHINTVAPFKAFRTKLRRWKKLRAEQSLN